MTKMNRALPSTLGLLAIAGVFAACGSESERPGEPGGASTDGPDASGGSDTIDRADAAAEGSADATADGSTSRPPPTVGNVTGFGQVSDEPAWDVACNTTHCYSASSAPTRLVNGAATAEALPKPPLESQSQGVTRVVVLGSDVFYGVEDFLQPRSVVFRLGATGHDQVGAFLPKRQWWHNLVTDGSRLYRASASGQVLSIDPKAGGAEAWVQQGNDVPDTARKVTVDHEGNVYVHAGKGEPNQGNVVAGVVLKLAAGTKTWVQIGGTFDTEGSAGPFLTTSWTGDVWLSGAKTLARLRPGAATWENVTIGEGVTSAVVVDGANTAWVVAADPSRIFRVPDGATSAVDTGVTVPTLRFMEGLAIDGDGRLLVAGWRSTTVAANDKPKGLFRSVP